MSNKYTIKDFLEVKAAGSPSFSPDGAYICYISNITGVSQAYITKPDSPDAQAEQITFDDESIAFARFSPTQNFILFSKDTGGDEQFQLYLYSLETKITEAITSDPKVRHIFGGFSHDGKYIYYSSNERNGTDMDVYEMELESRQKNCIYSAGGSAAFAGMSKNNKTAVIKRSNSNVDQDLFTYDRMTKETRHITPHEGTIYHSGTAWLSDSSGFFTLTDKDRDFIGLSFYDMQSASFREILNPEWDIDSFTLSYDSEYCALLINEDGYEKFSLYKSVELLQGEHAVNKTPSPLNTCIPNTSSVQSISFSKDSKRIALSINDSTRTTDVWAYSIEQNALTQITRSPQGVPPEDLVEPTLSRYETFDGLEVPVFTYKPKETPAGKKLPVIINIHGGPESQAQPTLALLTQFFVHQGYAVCLPNVRGSTGYGKTYLAMDDVEKRLDSVKDIAYLHKHIEEHMPELDSKKIILMGGSYGGFMVLAGLAFYPELWAGGVDIVGIANFVTFLENTAAWRRAIREAEYGSLAKGRAFLEQISPINHADEITAPLFIIHGANDPRVPLSEAEQIADKLKAAGKRADLLVYHDEGHGLAKLKNRLDAYPKVADFIAEIVK